jgi:hypothetical protein
LEIAELLTPHFIRKKLENNLILEKILLPQTKKAISTANATKQIARQLGLMP